MPNETTNRIQNARERWRERYVRLRQNDIVKRERIVKIVRNLFKRQGANQTTISHITAQSNIKKSAFYRYFRNREELMQAMVEREVIILHGKIQLVIDENDKAGKQLYNYLIARVYALKDLFLYYGKPENALGDNKAFLQSIQQVLSETDMEYIQDLLEDGVQRGEFDVEDVRLAAEIISGMLHLLENSFLDAEQSDILDKKVDMSIGWLIKGITK